MAENKQQKKFILMHLKFPILLTSIDSQRNENIEILYEHNLWLRKFFILHIKIQFRNYK